MISSMSPQLQPLVYTLQSQSFLKIYLRHLYFPWITSHFVKTNPKSSLLFANPSPIKTHESMVAHHSQYVWFRKLYILFSQYVFWNELKPIKPE